MESDQLILTTTNFPAQLLGVPERFRVKASQFTPSTQVLSSVLAPPLSVPVHDTVAPDVGYRLADEGVDA